MDLGAFLRYWSLTFAVFVFYIFALLVVLVGILADAGEAARKKRAERKPSPLTPDPLAGTTVAETLLPGPGQQLDDKRRWVAGLAADVLRQLKLSASVRPLILEDSKGHPLVHFTDGRRVQTYRVDRAIVEAAAAGDATRRYELAALLARHLTADFLGRESERPPKTTELAREAAAKPAAAKAAAPERAAPVPAAAKPEAEQPAAPEPPATEGPAAPAAEPPAAERAEAGKPAAAADAEGMSREERIAAARAKAEALRAARQKEPPKG